MSSTTSTSSPPDLERLRIPRGETSYARRRSRWPAVTLIVLALAGTAYAFRDKLGLGGDDGDTVATVRATKVSPGQAQAGDVTSNGYVIANRTASLATVLSGRMVELNVDVGDHVEAKAIVARIQYDDLEATVTEATRRAEAVAVQVREATTGVKTAELLVAEATAEHAVALANGDNLKAEIDVRRKLLVEAQEQLAHAKREVERNRKLWDEKRINEDAWDAVQTAERAAAHAVATATSRITAAEGLVTAWKSRVARLEKAVATAQQQVAQRKIAVERATAEHATAVQAVAFARIQLEKTIIRAPFDGLVIRKDAEIGEVIAPTGAGNSRGSVVTMIDPNSLEMQVELNERHFLGIEEGRRATIFLDAEPDRGWPGSVRKVWPGADRGKGSIELRVAFTERPPHARPDMAGRVVLHKSDVAPDRVAAAYVTVPSRTVVRRGGKTFVFVVEGGVLRRQDVDLGDVKGTAVVVVEGLDGGERLISSPTADMRDGESVRVQGGA